MCVCVIVVVVVFVGTQCRFFSDNKTPTWKRALFCEQHPNPFVVIVPQVTVIELLEDNMEPTRDQNVKGFKVQGLHMKDGVWNIERREEFEGINQERFDGLGLEGVKDERERERILKEVRVLEMNKIKAYKRNINVCCNCFLTHFLAGHEQFAVSFWRVTSTYLLKRLAIKRFRSVRQR